MSPQDEPSLFWTAFRYVSDELTAPEAEAFEARLADDQSAREAVAQAVELSQTVVAAVPQMRPIEEPVVLAMPALVRERWMQPVGWLAAGAAACLALVIAYQSYWPSQAIEQRSSLSLAQAGLAEAWAEAQEQADDAALAENDELNQDDALLPMAAIDLLARSEISDEDLESLTPSWMLAAVSAEQGATSGATKN
jgi:negative regulator of sigma E activity